MREPQVKDPDRETARRNFNLSVVLFVAMIAVGTWPVWKNFL